MATLIAPSGLSLIQEGMKRALGRTASSGEQARALDYWLPEIKNDIWTDDGGSHQLLASDALLLLTEGTHLYDLASDFDTPKSFSLLDGDVRDNAQAGTSTTIRLVSTDSSQSEGRVGKEIVLLSGTGAGQKRQITGFDTTTKDATVDTAWSTIPDSTTGYLVVSEYIPFRLIDPTTFATITDRTRRARPESGMAWNAQLYVQGVPDKTYPLWYQYWVNILKVDMADTNERHQNMLANWRSLFTEGIFTKTLQNEDDARYPQAFQVYHQMLSKVTQRAQRSGRVEPSGF